MPHLDNTGPKGEGSLTGRKLGKCSKASDKEKLEKLGKGMGERRKSGGGTGKGNRHKSNES
jgi:hypothetical protein